MERIGIESYKQRGMCPEDFQKPIYCECGNPSVDDDLQLCEDCITEMEENFAKEEIEINIEIEKERKQKEKIQLKYITMTVHTLCIDDFLN